MFRKTSLFTLLALAGFCWALLRAVLLLSFSGLSQEYEARELLAVGKIASIPTKTDRNTRFEFEIEVLEFHGQTLKSPGRVKLSWYGWPPEMQLGEQWQLLIKLKRPHGYKNPGGFEYETWLFQNRIRATGYVKKKPLLKNQSFYPDKPTEINKRLSDVKQYAYIDRIRQAIFSDVSTVLEQDDSRGLIKALSIGERSDITRDQWQVLTRTGTNHLMAISGLHVGLVAGFIFYIMKWFWRLVGSYRFTRFVPCGSLIIPANKFAAIFALMSAIVYAALAGFSIPTQRALIMICVVMLSLFLNRGFRPSTVLSIALLAVLLIDPFSVLSPGFWLSFTAVAVILFAMSGRINTKNVWWKWGRAQWVVMVGMLPLMLILFEKISLVSPLANLIAVPWVSLVTVPLTLSGSLIVLIVPELGRVLLHWAASSFELLWMLLDWLASLSFAQWQQHEPVSWTIIPGLAGIAYLLMPRGVPARWVGLFAVLPMIFVKPLVPEKGDVWFTLLDVGQGLSAVVQTRQHVLVYDTGPRLSSEFDTGRAVVVPFLRHNGINAIDTLIVSHGDNDHIGGLDSILNELPARRILTSVPEKVPRNFLLSNKVTNCAEIRNWNWDGVRFEIISPAFKVNHSRLKGNVSINHESVTKYRDKPLFKGNDASCVLKITGSGGRILLTGDIEKPAEKYLLESIKNGTLRDDLKSDVLVVPHHGSRTSSTRLFVAAVKPTYALLPVGYKNRFKLPRESVLDRYRAIGSTIIDTASYGAIQFKINAVSGVGHPVLYREQNRRYFDQ